jgi:GTPase SAR1 family protein
MSTHSHPPDCEEHSLLNTDDDETVDIDYTILEEIDHMDPNKQQYTVLVLGERGVGKTSFIRALKEYVSTRSTESSHRHIQTQTRRIQQFAGQVQPRIFSELNYYPTENIFAEYIPKTYANSLYIESIFENIEKGRYSPEVSRFIMNPHFDKLDKYYLLEDFDMISSGLQIDREVGEIMITEFSSTTREFPSNFADHFDKIIIMGEYSDITTLRSIQYWVELIKAPKSKTIVCVNKCDVPPISIANDFQSRKAKILKHYSDQCELEFMSVKTGANIGFLYKYI